MMTAVPDDFTVEEEVREPDKVQSTVVIDVVQLAVFEATAHETSMVLKIKSVLMRPWFGKPSSTVPPGHKYLRNVDLCHVDLQDRRPFHNLNSISEATV